MNGLGRVLIPVVMVVLQTGCSQPAAPPPPPASLGGDAMGYYCGMQVTQHAGPKGHIFIAGVADPFWFSSVRDALAFTHLPEEPKSIVAIYVNDMGGADWDKPDDSTWIDARTAWYVVGSRRVGGMGAAEIVPFSQRADADAFAGNYGGEVRRLDEIPEDAILSTAPQSPG